MNIIAHPNPVLALKADEVDPKTDLGLRDLAKEMAELMYDAPGVGLAATQVGVMKRVIVYDASDDGNHLVVICNPRIVQMGEETEFDEEGCLSFPGISVPVERSLHVVVEALGLDGEPLTIDADGFHARLLQHEIDHLEGVVLIDRATPQDRKQALRDYRVALERGARPGQTSI